MDSKKTPKNIFVSGAIGANFIAEEIAKHSTKKNIGAHSIFLGQVRNDIIENKEVKAIEYSSYQDMAINKMNEIREEIFSKFNLTCLHVYHSLGIVEAGEICLFVFASSKHRKDCIQAINELVEKIKKELPIFGKEIFEDKSFVWKKGNE